MLSTVPCSGFLYLQFLARCHPYILFHDFYTCNIIGHVSVRLHIYIYTPECYKTKSTFCMLTSEPHNSLGIMEDKLLSSSMKLKKTDTTSTEMQTTEYYKHPGLGRRVDTKESPWLGRTSFQVSDPSNEKTLVSRVTRDIELKAGVKANNQPASLSVLIPSTCVPTMRKYIVGTKVTNSTISFRARFLRCSA